MTKYYSIALVLTGFFYFVVIIYMFITKKGTNVKMIDKNLRDLMLSSNNGNL